jgi:hypothetical protein
MAMENTDWHFFWQQKYFFNYQVFKMFGAPINEVSQQNIILKSFYVTYNVSFLGKQHIFVLPCKHSVNFELL